MANAVNLGSLPAWLQTFAALVALGISVWAALRVGRNEKRRDKLKARGIAVAIYPELLKLETVVVGVKSTLNHLKTNSRVLVGQSIAATVQYGQIAIPPMLDRNTDALYLLGEPAGPNCLQMISILLQYNALVEEVVSRIIVLSSGQWLESIDHLEQHLSLVSAVISKCKSEVGPIHNAVRG